MATVEEAFAIAKDPSVPRLGLSYNGKSIGNGDHIPKSETQNIPKLTFTSPSGTYLIVCIDLDAPFASFAFLSPILHWMQPGLKGASSTGEAELTASGVPFVIDYRGAGPPPGAAPHRYMFLLYEQPEDFDGKKFGQPAEGKDFGMVGRIRYDLAKLVREAKLGKPVAANWFVSN